MRGRLVWFIYGHGVIIVAVALLATFLSTWNLRDQHERDALALSRHFANEASSAASRDAALARARDAGVRMSLYDAAGRLLGSTEPTTPAAPRVDRQALATDGFQRLGERVYAIALPEGALAVVGDGIGGPPFWLLPLSLTFAAALVLALALSRRLAHPLQRVADAAYRFGAGDLKARTGVLRRDEIGEVARAFDDMAERVTALMASQQQLLANVSHELRTPLARMQVAVDLMSDGIGSQAKELLPEITTDIAELERLLEDVQALARFDLARLRDGAVPLSKTRVAAADLLARAVERFRAQHRAPELSVELEPLPELEVDAMLVRRVIENLLDNARKYSNPGTPIALAANARPGEVTITVADRGIGIDAADLPHVFKPFFRTDRSRSRDSGGVGLGLSLAHSVVSAHGGTISLQSEPAKGTTVTVTLPVKA
jgi:signal transduction histidine kinase